MARAAVLGWALGAGHGRRGPRHGRGGHVGGAVAPHALADVVALEPDVVVLAPCGFDLDRTLSEVVPLDLSAHLLGTPARQESRVFAVDANALFSRPGPRVVDGVELLAYLLHPDEYPDPGALWSRVRL